MDGKSYYSSILYAFGNENTVNTSAKIISQVVCTSDPMFLSLLSVSTTHHILRISCSMLRTGYDILRVISQELHVRIKFTHNDRESKY